MQRLNTFETENIEFSCSELFICNKKRVCFSVYQPPSQEKVEILFEELTYFLSKVNKSY